MIDNLQEDQYRMNRELVNGLFPGIFLLTRFIIVLTYVPGILFILLVAPWVYRWFVHYWMWVIK